MHYDVEKLKYMILDIYILTYFKMSLEMLLLFVETWSSDE